MTTRWSTDPAAGPYPVRIDRGEWADAVRARIVPYKIYRPEVLSDATYPVVIWSHGLGGTRDGAGFLGRYLASHGYIQVHIQHDGTDDSLWRGMPGHPWDNIRNQTIPWETVRNRYLDASFAVDQLQEMNKADALYAGKMDFTRLGMSGHSFGALTTQVMCGQLAGRDTPEDLHDDRFVAGILYSPVPAFRHQMGGRDVYATIKKPLLHMTGTEDNSPIEGFGIERRLEVFECAGHTDQHALILEGGDHMVFNGSRGQLESYDDIGKHQDIIAVMARTWWECWLNANHDARAFLNGEGVRQYLGADGAYKTR